MNSQSDMPIDPRQFLQDKAQQVAIQIEELKKGRMAKDPAMTGEEGQDLKSKLRSGQFQIP
tara:strand:- start:211 stop:393 length:183 start_codon:yes stop_codon:yes gene_type:complete